MTCPDHIPSYLRDPNIDPEIYELYISQNEQNWCTSRLACGCYCPNPCGNSEHCHAHFYSGDFNMARTHTNFSNTSQRLILPKINRDTNINELFGMLPPEILMKIVRLIHFADLKQLYIMRVPAILALVQGDLVFNYTTLFAHPALTICRVYKFESEYARGLRAIDTAIHMVRVSGSVWRNSRRNSSYSCLHIEKERTNDRRNYNIDSDAYDDNVYHREWSRTPNKDKYIQTLRFTPGRVLHPDVTHNIGHRRMFPGILADHKIFQILNDFVYDDFFSQNKAETRRIIEHFNANINDYPMINPYPTSPWT